MDFVFESSTLFLYDLPEFFVGYTKSMVWVTSDWSWRRNVTGENDTYKFRVRNDRENREREGATKDFNFSLCPSWLMKMKRECKRIPFEKWILLFSIEVIPFTVYTFSDTVFVSLFSWHVTRMTPSWKTMSTTICLSLWCLWMHHRLGLEWTTTNPLELVQKSLWYVSLV